MLIHVEQAAAPDLEAAAAVIMSELTGGTGAGGGSRQAVRLADLPARRVMGAFPAAGAIQQIDAVVTVEKGRVNRRVAGRSVQVSLTVAPRASK